MNMIAVLNTFTLAILALVFVGLALTNLPVWWPPSRHTLLARRIEEERQENARRTEAVRQGLEAIRQSIDGRTGEPTEAARAALNAEVDDLLTLLQDHRAESLWRRSSAQRKTFDDFATSLATLIRALKARHDAIIGAQAGPSFPLGVAPTAGEARAGTAPAETGSGGSNDREAALLAEISKKFYESWAFKGLSAALLAGVALAVGGTFLLGGESYRLSEQLQKSYDRGVSQIEKIQDQAQTSLTKGTDLLKTTTAAVQTQANQFSADAAKAIVALREEQQKFADKLKTDTVDKVVMDLRQDIEHGTGVIANRIRAEETGLQPKFDALAARVTALNTTVTTLETKLGAAHDTMEKLTPRLEPLGQKASAADQAVARIQAADIAAAQSKMQAEGYAATALQAQHDAATSRDRVATQLDKVSNAIPPQSAALDQITAAVAMLKTSLQQATESIAGVTQDAAKLREEGATVRSISGQLSTVKEALAKLQAERIAAPETIKPPPPEPTDPGIRTVANLTETERCAVQRELNANGYGSGTIDGRFGPTTYRAIQRWQRKHRTAVNGRLTPDQIEMLIGKRGVPLPPCPPQ
jgi:uncharacterized membrane-anchored protein YhcB (DUF1043 family)